MPAVLVQGKGLGLDSDGGRPLLRDLNLCLERERVALIGRNGVGKSTLLRVLAGHRAPEHGSLRTRVETHLVAQDIELGELGRELAELGARARHDHHLARALARDRSALGLEHDFDGEASRGQARKLALLAARHSHAELLLLDEPGEDLDAAGHDWLCRWLREEQRGLLMVSHERALLRCFAHFFIVAESGCRYVPGSFDELLRVLESEQQDSSRQYLRKLGILDERERHDERVRRRRARKKRVGRLHELRRCTSRCRLNEKRSYAQESQARAAKIREHRITAVHSWTKAARRALRVELALELPVPKLPAPDGRPLVELHGVAMTIDGRTLFDGIELELRRERLAIVGPNGAGKTTLLKIMLGEIQPSRGRASCRRERIGVITQGATNWLSDDSLLTQLGELAPSASPDELAALLLAHGFPLALAERPLRSLSPGERVRAALIALYQRAPELLILDEPSSALDLVGLCALQRAVQAWPGGLVVVSHDRELLGELALDRTLSLGEL